MSAAAQSAEDSAAKQESRRAAYTSPRPDIAALVPPGAASVLDVGCSNGMLGQSLRSATPGRSVWGIEYDARLAEEASQKLDRVITADLNRFDWSVPFSGTRFDCIIFADVLEHLLDPAAVLKASLSTLAPGGCVIISLPNIRHVSALSSIFVGGTFPRRARGIFDSTHLRWFTYGDAAAMIADAGLTVDASNHSLRVGDSGGGRLNRIVNRVFGHVADVGPVREFLAYQFCVRAVRRQS